MDQGRDRRRTLHGIRQPGVQRNLSRLPGAAEEQKQRNRRDQRPRGGERGRGLGEYRREIERPHTPEDQEHRDEETEVPDPVHDERFLACVGVDLLVEPEPDEQIRTESHAFPADKHHREARAQHEGQHEEHEQVQIREIAIEARVLAHVSGGVHMNEKSNAGHDKNHQAGKMIQHEPELRLKPSCLDPCEVVPQDRESLVWCGEHLQEFPNRNQERQPCRSHCDRADDVLRQAFPGNAVNCSAEQGQDRYEPEQIHIQQRGELATKKGIATKRHKRHKSFSFLCLFAANSFFALKHRFHHLSKLLLSTLSDSRLRNIAITRARPTAASAAATTSTKNTKIWPLICRC